MKNNERTKQIRARVNVAEVEHANRVAGAIGSDVSAIIRGHFVDLGIQVGIELKVDEAVG